MNSFDLIKQISFCLFQGWLWMKTPDSSWILKWIVLCVPTLQVHTNKEDEQGTPEVTVDLPTITNYREVPTDIKKYGFEIQWAGATLTLSAATEIIRSNWLQALRKAVPLPTQVLESPMSPYKVFDSPVSPSCKILESPISPSCKIVESPISPFIPRSVLGSSDEEYRTASEGGKKSFLLLKIYWCHKVMYRVSQKRTSKRKKKANFKVESCILTARGCTGISFAYLLCTNCMYNKTFYK